MKKQGERIFLTKEEALPLINTKNYHTFDNTLGLLVGCDGSESYIHKLLDDALSIELSGKAARSMKHGLAVFTKQDRLLFIETLEDKIIEFEKTIPLEDTP